MKSGQDPKMFFGNDPEYEEDRKNALFVLLCSNLSCKTLKDDLMNTDTVNTFDYNQGSEIPHIYMCPSIAKWFEKYWYEVESIKLAKASKRLENIIREESLIHSDNWITKLVVYYRLKGISFEKISSIIQKEHNHSISWQALQNRLNKFSKSLMVE